MNVPSPSPSRMTWLQYSLILLLLIYIFQPISVTWHQSLLMLFLFLYMTPQTIASSSTPLPMAFDPPSHAQSSIFHIPDLQLLLHDHFHFASHTRTEILAWCTLLIDRGLAPIYATLTKDIVFLHHVEYSMAFAVGQLITLINAQLQVADCALAIVSSFAVALQHHIALVQEAQDTLGPILGPLNTYEKARARGLDIDRICSTNKALHPATCSDEDRVSYLRKFVDRILHQILSLDDLQCAPAVAIAVEMLVTQVLDPIFKYDLTPENLNAFMVRQIHKASVKREQQGIYTPGRVPGGYSANDLGWHSFAGHLSMAQAESRLQHRSPGTFLIRKTRKAEMHKYAIGYSTSEGVCHIQCRFEHESYARVSEENDIDTVYLTLTAFLSSISELKHGLQLGPNAVSRSEAWQSWVKNVGEPSPRPERVMTPPNQRPTKHFFAHSVTLSAETEMLPSRPPASIQVDTASLSAEYDAMHGGHRHVLILQCEFTAMQLQNEDPTDTIFMQEFCNRWIDVFRYGLLNVNVDLFDILVKTTSSCNRLAREHVEVCKNRKHPLHQWILLGLTQRELVRRMQYLMEQESWKNATYRPCGIVYHTEDYDRLLNAVANLQSTSSAPSEFVPSPFLKRIREVGASLSTLITTNEDETQVKEHVQHVRAENERLLQVELGISDHLQQSLSKSSRPTWEQLLEWQIASPTPFPTVAVHISQDVVHALQSASPRDLTNKMKKSIVKYQLDVSCAVCGSSWSLYRRYSDFLSLYTCMKRNVPAFIFAFPPKRTFGNLDPVVTTQRKKAFNDLIHLLLSSPALATCHELMQFLNVPVHLTSRVHTLHMNAAPLTVEVPSVCSSTVFLNDTIASPGSIPPPVSSFEETQQDINRIYCSPRHVEALGTTLFDLVSTIFRLSSWNVLRQNMMSLLRRIIVLSTQTAFLEKLNEWLHYETFTTKCRLECTGLRKRLEERESLFSTTPRILPTTPINPKLLEIARCNWKITYRFFMEQILPASPWLVSFLGEEALKNGLTVVHTMMQCPKILHSLVFTFLDILLLQCFSADRSNHFNKS